MRKILIALVVLMVAVYVNGATKTVSGTSVVLGDWYEALSDDEGISCARWDDFWMGANVAIPVTGLSSPLAASDVVVTAGTYTEYGTPYVLSETEMWNRYGVPVKRQVELGNVVYEEEDEVWANWETEDEFAYELAADIWPNWTQVSGRQWILIPTGVPRSGTHTFSVKINGVAHDEYLVSFEMGEDQESVPDEDKPQGGGDNGESGGEGSVPVVSDVAAKQRYPWNGLVDITFKVSGISGTSKGFKFVVSAIMPDSGAAKRLSSYWVVKNGEKTMDRVVSANGVYRLLWDAKADLGAVRYTNMVVRVSVGDNHEKIQLWEGGPYWATTNIGAEEPWESGYYFWWGDTIGYKRENDKWVASDGSNSNFSFTESNTSTINKDTSTLQNEGWIVTRDGTTVLASEHDAAHVHWGDDWRMPTKQEFNDLENNCNWTWMTMNGVNGYVVCGRGGYAANSIFLPCADEGCGNPLQVGTEGSYWSSVPHSDNRYSWGLIFYSGLYDNSFYYSRTGLWSVRPVQSEVIGGDRGNESSSFTENDSISFLLDTKDSFMERPGGISLCYDSSWVGGDSSAEVVILADGLEIKRVTGEGEFAWSPTTPGKHTLTYTTYIDGVSQDEVYTATVFKDWKYTDEDGKATIVSTTLTSGDVIIPSEIDGCLVTGLRNGLFAECAGLTSITIPNSVTDIGGILSGVLEQKDWIPMEDELDDDSVVYQSDDIDHGGSTYMTMTIEGPLEFSFDWKVSSESGWDYLKWYLDGTLKSEISGAGGDWQTINISIPSGEHTIKWEYSKDGSVDTGEDCSWVRLPRPKARIFEGCENLCRVTLPIVLKDVVSFEGCPEDIEVVYVEYEGPGEEGEDSIVSSDKQYCIVDLSGGASATSYPVLYMDSVPEGGWTDEYKTTKLVLRRIEAGTYERNGNVTITTPFYCGVFETTQKQYELVTGKKPSSFKGDTLPVENVSWADLRGDSFTYNWPTVKMVSETSFVGLLQSRTGLDFDLPTEAQWGYACRAGTTTCYYWGNSMNSAYVWHRGNANEQTHCVGMKIPNDWGLYDMNGNVWEWCLDWYGTLSNGNDPEGPITGSQRVHCGGAWDNSSDDNFTSSSRGSFNPSSGFQTLGIRLVYTVSEEGCDDGVVISPITYQNLRGATHTNPSSYQEGTHVSFANPSGVTDYTFAGWTPLQITDDMTGDIVVTANWEWTPQDAVVDASITGWKPVTVKADWAKTELEQKFGVGKKEAFIAKFGDNLTSAMTKKTGKRDSDGKELLVWHDYVAGTDPTDINSTFKAKIEMKDGKPVISWEPDLNSAGEERVYTVHGKESLSDVWHAPVTELDHFFKVDVFIPHDVTVTLNAGEGSSVESIPIYVGQPVGELPTPTREGYSFAGWFMDVEGSVDVPPEMVVTADMTVYAQWTIKNYDVVFEANGGNGGVTKTYTHGATLGELPVPTREGYTFTGWFTAASGGTQVDASTAVTGSQTIYAQWTINSYDVVFDANDGSGGVTKVYTHGATLGELPTLMRDGYKFLGWFTAQEGGDAVTPETVVTADMTVYAHWTIKSYAVVFDANGGNGGVSMSYTHGAVLGELPTPTREGYIFAGWWTAASSGAQVTASTVVTSSQTLYARWDAHEKVQLWENGPYWATTNIGAEKPEDYGYYFWWGDTVGYKREGNKWVASDGWNSNFSFTESNTPTYGESNSTLQSEGWLSVDGVLAPEHDAAQKHWGGDWRMPTKQEFDELDNKCDWTWTTMNGVNGYVVRGRGDYASASIFLPSTGDGFETSLYYAGSIGGYWSSVSDADYSHGAWSLYFDSSDHSTSHSGRYYGLSVRPLQGFTK